LRVELEAILLTMYFSDIKIKKLKIRKKEKEKRKKKKRRGKNQLHYSFSEC